MSSSEDCSEADRLYIAIEPSPVCEPANVTGNGPNCIDLPDRTTHDEHRVHGLHHPAYTTGPIAADQVHHCQTTFRPHRWNDGTWQMTTPTLQHGVHASLSRSFSPVSSPPPYVRPFSPVHSSGVHQPYLLPPPVTNQDPSNNYLGHSIMYRQTDSRDLDAEVAYYSSCGKNTLTPFEARSFTIPSSAYSCHPVTPTDSLVNVNELSRVAHVPIPKRKRKGSNDKSTRGNRSYKRNDKPPYTYYGMIVAIIQNSPDKMLSLTEIIEEIPKFFEFFRGSYTGWRDSIRHYLSHYDCFIRTNLVVSQGNRNIFKWSVDLSKVPPAAFCMQQTRVGRTGEYKKHIHEQLGLPLIELPGGVTPGISCPCSQPMKAVMSRERTRNVPMSPETLPPHGSHTTQLRLPSISNCVMPNDSPEVYRNRDAVNTRNVSTVSSTETEYEAITPTKLPATCKRFGNHIHNDASESRAEPEVKVDFFDIAQFILATEREEGTSSAAENLSYLC